MPTASTAARRRLAIAALLIATPAFAQSGDASADASKPATTGDPAPAVGGHAATEAPAGVVPLADYTGDFWTRSAVLGDLGGARTDLAEMGIQFNVDWTNTLQSVVDGGRDQTTKIGGTADFNITFDLMRMKLLPGAFVKFRGESRYGESVNGDTGTLLPVSSDMLFPLTSELNEGVPFDITNLTYYQFLSDHFAILAGKFDTLDGDPNEFASGRGLTQFQNLNFVFNAVPLLTVPYDVLGAGVIIMPNKWITIISNVFTTTDVSSVSGFSDLDNGLTWATEANFQYRLGRLPGGFNIGGTYAFDNDFKTVNRRYTFEPGQGVVVPPDQNDSWSVYLSGWQYLFAEDDGRGDEPLDPENRIPDLKGLGVFARLGFADQDTNPIQVAFSVGLGGRGAIPGRDNDIFGVGYFYNDAQENRLQTILNLKSYGQGFEAFYSVAITPAMHLTFDLQVVEPVSNNLDTAVILGGRFLVHF